MPARSLVWCGVWRCTSSLCMQSTNWELTVSAAGFLGCCFCPGAGYVAHSLIAMCTVPHMKDSDAPAICVARGSEPGSAD
jgi:predicted metal-binding protein